MNEAQIVNFKSMLPHTSISIFTQMSQLAQRHNAVNLSQGFPDFPVDPQLIDCVNKFMREGFNQYAPMVGAEPLRRAIVEKYSSQYDIEIDPDNEVTVTAGGTQALYTAIGTLISTGDEAIIFEPAYDSYRPSIEAYGGRAVPIRLLAPDFNISWDDVRDKITSRTKLIIVNNPNNPSGRVLDREDIEALESIVKKYNLFVLSDEVYEHIVFDGHKHISVFSSEILRQRSFVVASFGKLLHVTGWKVGFIIGSPFLTAEFRKLHQFNVFSVNTPVQFAIAEYLSDSNYYKHLPIFFQEKRDYLVNALSSTRFRVLPCEGTYFMLLEYSEISDKTEMEFATYLAEHAKVVMIPISSFYSTPLDQGLLRICFAKKEETLDKAIKFLRQF